MLKSFELTLIIWTIIPPESLKARITTFVKSYMMMWDFKSENPQNIELCFSLWGHSCEAQKGQNQ
jgi:hypothetical protein